MLRNTLTLAILSTLLVFADTASGQLVGDVDGDGNVDFGDVDLWNVCWNFNLNNICNLDVNNDGFVCCRDRDFIVVGMGGGGGTNGRMYGDLNWDGAVNSADLNILANHWGLSWSGSSTGDINGDGTVDSADLNIIGLNWGKTVPLPPWQGGVQDPDIDPNLDAGRCPCPHIPPGGGGDQ